MSTELDYRNEVQGEFYDSRRANNLLKLASQTKIRILNNRELSCGHCPMTLMCMNQRPISPLENQLYALAVCKTCWCVHFTKRDDPSILYICGNIRKGTHRSPISVNARPNYDDSYVKTLQKEALVDIAIGRSSALTSATECGCKEATIADIFPELTGHRYYRIRHHTPLDGRNKRATPPHLRKQLDNFDCTTPKIHKRNTPVEEF